MGRLVILSGPSCVGKGPLHAALRKFHPELAGNLRPVVLYNSRSPRPAELDGVDYHFRTREQIEALRGKDGFTVLDVRGDLLAVDLAELARTVARGDALFEGNPFVGKLLLDCPLPAGVQRLGVFLAPLSRREIEFLQAQPGVRLPDLVADVMRRKLLRRTTRQKTHLSRKDLEEIERRCTSAYRELGYAHLFEHVIPNHDGEDSENWSAFYYPLADARLALQAVAALLAGRPDPHVETWPADLIP